MPYSWMSEALDFTQMVMDIQKQLKITIFIIPNNFCFNNIAKKSFPGTHRGPALLLGVRGSGPHPDGHGHPETTKIILFYSTQQLLLQQHYQKVIPWDTSGSMPYTWVSEALDLAQMVMDIFFLYFRNQWLKSFHLTSQP